MTDVDVGKDGVGVRGDRLRAGSVEIDGPGAADAGVVGGDVPLDVDLAVEVAEGAEGQVVADVHRAGDVQVAGAVDHHVVERRDAGVDVGCAAAGELDRAGPGGEGPRIRPIADERERWAQDADLRSGTDFDVGKDGVGVRGDRLRAVSVEIDGPGAADAGVVGGDVPLDVDLAVEVAEERRRSSRCRRSSRR